MEIEGNVLKILPEQKGESKKGNTWRKQDFILETQGQYPKKVCITIWGDKIEQFQLNEGEQVKAYIDIESREFNSRWYTDVKAWNLEKTSAGVTNDYPSDIPPPPPPPEDQQPDFSGSDSEDDLPF